MSRKRFGRFRAPVQIRFDNGPHFTAEIVAEILKEVGTQHCKTLPYNSEENSLVERSNKEINRRIRALILDSNSPENYADSLPFVQRILNSNHSDILKVSAAELFFRKMLDLDSSLFLPSPERLTQSSNSPSISENMKKLLDVQDSMLTVAKSNLIATDNTHLSGNKTSLIHEFSVNSFVLVHYLGNLLPDCIQFVGYTHCTCNVRERTVRKCSECNAIVVRGSLSFIK